MIDLAALLDAVLRDGEPVCATARGERRRLTVEGGEALVDHFGDGSCACLSLRLRGAAGPLRIPGNHRVTGVDAGGWLLVPQGDGLPGWWLPALPRERRLDDQGRILAESEARIRGFGAGPEGLEADLEHPDGQAIDLVLWRLAGEPQGPLADLTGLPQSERAPVFLWGSHGSWRVPADLYRHLVHGSVFDLRFSWPHKRRAYSENEAHALHLALRNRELATGKGIYRLLREQVLLAVLARQEPDGAWRQGIWTADMECHFRLHCSAMHLLMDCLCEGPDENLRDALGRAAAFIARQGTTYLGETWFLHDSLEQDEETSRREMPGWHRCTTEGKDPGNTLVLNTHIDTLIALHRYGQLTGDAAFDEQVQSARRLLVRLLDKRPAEWLYRPLLSALYLTVLPHERAATLPLPLRAVKRLAREHLTPVLTRVKCRWPRLVMPGGFVDRALSLERFAHPYHAINLMDLVRFAEVFPGERRVKETIEDALGFAARQGLLTYWSEQTQPRYAVGFWAEALYRLCLTDGAWRYRVELAEALLTAAGCGLGMPPSLAGRNCEAILPERQMGSPQTGDGRLWVVNLSAGAHWEALVINPQSEDIDAELAGEHPHGPVWTPSWAPEEETARAPTLPPGTWARVGVGST